MRIHIVQKGDTLWKIAKQYAIGFEELKRLNAHLANPDYIVPGMEIYLPETTSQKGKMKEQPVSPARPPVVKEEPMKQMPAPIPKPVAPPAPPVMQQWQPQLPNWQAEFYFQPQFQAPVALPPQSQHTTVNFQPAPQMTPAAPVPQSKPQPQMMPQPMPMPMPMHQMQPCSCGCHNMNWKQEHFDQPGPMLSPIQREESPNKPCPEKEEQIQNYYDEVHQIEHMPHGCGCGGPQMMPYQMMPMHQMPMEHMPHGCGCGGPQMMPMHHMPMHHHMPIQQWHC